MNLRFDYILVIVRTDSSSNYWPNLRAIDPSLHTPAVMLQKLYYKVKKTELDIVFLTKCRDHNITPNHT
jgi:hypothetical protein